MTQDLHIVVFAGGEMGDIGPSDVPSHTFAIAADSGLHNALLLGVRVDLVVGDLDSVSSLELDEAQEMEISIEKHNAEKDETDLELALDRAVSLNPHSITVIGGAGGRFDHWFANVLLFAAPKYADIKLRALCGPDIITVIRGDRVLDGELGSYISLFSLDGEATGVSTSGLLYEINDDSLAPLSVLGVSNEFTSTVATVSVKSGVVVAIQPFAVHSNDDDQESEMTYVESGDPLAEIDEEASIDVAPTAESLIQNNPGNMFN